MGTESFGNCLHVSFRWVSGLPKSHKVSCRPEPPWPFASSWEMGRGVTDMAKKHRQTLKLTVFKTPLTLPPFFGRPSCYEEQLGHWMLDFPLRPSRRCSAYPYTMKPWSSRQRKPSRSGSWGWRGCSSDNTGQSFHVSNQLRITGFTTVSPGHPSCFSEFIYKTPLGCLLPPLRGFNDSRLHMEKLEPSKVGSVAGWKSGLDPRLLPLERSLLSLLFFRPWLECLVPLGRHTAHRAEPERFPHNEPGCKSAFESSIPEINSISEVPSAQHWPPIWFLREWMHFACFGSLWKWITDGTPLCLAFLISHELLPRVAVAHPFSVLYSIPLWRWAHTGHLHLHAPKYLSQSPFRAMVPEHSRIYLLLTFTHPILPDLTHDSNCCVLKQECVLGRAVCGGMTILKAC
jgi:hypothetical protein